MKQPLVVAAKVTALRPCLVKVATEGFKIQTCGEVAVGNIEIPGFDPLPACQRHVDKWAVKDPTLIHAGRSL